MDGLFAFQVAQLWTGEGIQHTVYFPLTCQKPHTIKMFYFVYGYSTSVCPKRKEFSLLALSLNEINLKTSVISHE